MIFWNRLMSSLPNFILFGVLIFTYIIYFITNLKPQFDGLTYEIIIQHLFILIFLISLFRAMYLKPGLMSKETIDEALEQMKRFQQLDKEITDQKEKQSLKSGSKFKAENEEVKCLVNLDSETIIIEEEKTIKLDQNLNTQSQRFCKKCCIPKPPRVHHCSACNNCWQKMDHHCLWINNCVAKDNYKMFICMVFFNKFKIRDFLLIWVTISQYNVFQMLITNDVSDISDLKLYLIVLHFYLIFLLSVLIFGFFLFHIYLISQNKTTLEQLEDKPDKHKYNRGIWLNFQFILGSNILYWFLPIQ
ncbi:unnamed protein product [Paramecium sonneborni]|uniref:Palmitoyltransferase n=1 Tax=Paramecium sonneborni TaxID=65129 RepID=A0A8S1KUW0_9CILI|nr:unnamed protein product [Paramecium sonneborni]